VLGILKKMGHRMCKFFVECKKPSMYLIKHSKLALCKHHFVENVEKRIKKNIDKYHMFHEDPDYKLLVAISGGKDSQVLLTIIKKLFPKYPITEALYVDLGIHSNEYSKDSLRIAENLCKKLDVPFNSVNVKKEYGISIDDIHDLKQKFTKQELETNNFHFRGECSYCGIFKRYIINRFASENEFTVIATGHNLTDEFTSLMNNVFNVNLTMLSRSEPIAKKKVKDLIPRVKPMFYISEEEIMMYAYFENIEHLATECVYSNQSPSIKMKKVFQEIESNRKGNMIATVRRYYKKIQPVIHSAVYKEDNNSHCKKCGMLTYSNKCNFCKTIKFLQDRFKQAENQLS
jgi:tRNA-5-methyluridine54 2-sulfurtransferase